MPSYIKCVGETQFILYRLHIYVKIRKGSFTFFVHFLHNFFCSFFSIYILYHNFFEKSSFSAHFLTFPHIFGIIYIEWGKTLYPLYPIFHIIYGETLNPIEKEKRNDSKRNKRPRNANERVSKEK